MQPPGWARECFPVTIRADGAGEVFDVVHLDFSYSRFFFRVIPWGSVTAFIWDDDSFVADGEGVVEIGTDFADSPRGAVDGKLSAKSIMHRVQWLDDKVTTASSVVRIEPQFLHRKICSVGCISLRFVGISGFVGLIVSWAAEECSNVTGGTGEGGIAVELLLNPALPGKDTGVTFEENRLDTFAIGRWSPDDV